MDKNGNSESTPKTMNKETHKTEEQAIDEATRQ